jgi:hypothetical protein
MKQSLVQGWQTKEYRQGRGTENDRDWEKEKRIYHVDEWVTIVRPLNDLKAILAGWWLTAN